jgi:nitrogen fixation NifU-like protein
MPGLEDLYREIILDHYRNPRNRGELPSPPALRAEGFNPLCGDEVVISLTIDGDIITDLKVGGQGCSISQSSASMMSAAIKGKTVAQARSTVKAFRAMMSLHGQQLDGVPPSPGGLGAGGLGGPGSQGGLGAAPGGGDGSAVGAGAAGEGGLPDDVAPDERTAAEVAAAEGVVLGDLEALQGVVKFPVRIKCATLPWHTLTQALDEAQKHDA